MCQTLQALDQSDLSPQPYSHQVSKLPHVSGGDKCKGKRCRFFSVCSAQGWPRRWWDIWAGTWVQGRRECAEQAQRLRQGWVPGMSEEHEGPELQKQEADEVRRTETRKGQACRLSPAGHLPALPMAMLPPAQGLCTCCASCLIAFVPVTLQETVHAMGQVPYLLCMSIYAQCSHKHRETM